MSPNQIFAEMIQRNMKDVTLKKVQYFIANEKKKNGKNKDDYENLKTFIVNSTNKPSDGPDDEAFCFGFNGKTIENGMHVGRGTKADPFFIGVTSKNWVQAYNNSSDTISNDVNSGKMLKKILLGHSDGAYNLTRLGYLVFPLIMTDCNRKIQYLSFWISSHWNATTCTR